MISSYGFGLMDCRDLFDGLPEHTYVTVLTIITKINFSVNPNYAVKVSKRLSHIVIRADCPELLISWMYYLIF